MKKVLITGKDSYIGCSVKKCLDNYSNDYQLDELDMLDESWKKKDFSEYDCVYHVAGLVHKKNISADLYDKVNHILAVEVAKKAKKEGVVHFVLMSSGAVYSQSDSKHVSIIVNENTECNPSTLYGRSKLQADIEIRELEDSSFYVAIIRPPMVYGYGAKGNYTTLSSFAKKIRIFPKVDNLRSMIYIDNLCEFVRLIIQNKSRGIFLPQNSEYVNTTDLVNTIAKVHNRKILDISLGNWLIDMLGKRINIFNKVFGSYVYEKIDYFENAYQVVGLQESIIKTELGEKCNE